MIAATNSVTRQEVQASGCDLVPKTRPGRPEFESAYRRGYPYTVRFLRSLGASRDLAEETAQAAWVRGWERIEQLRAPEALPRWVNSIAKNLLRSRYNREARWEELSPTLAAKEVDRLNRAQVHQILDRCPGKLRQLLSRFYLEGYTAQEIADATGGTAVAVRVQVHRARRWIRETLGELDVTLTAQTALS